VRWNKKPPVKSDKTQTIRSHKRGVVGYSRKTALLEEAITQMNAGKYGRSSAALKELLALDPNNMEARRLFATLHLRLGSLLPAKHAFDSLIDEAFQRQDYWLAESLLREYLTTAQRCVPFLEKLGSIYQEKGDALEAAAEYGKAIDILIEDPDPENPQRASQLYAKIRELAPASPVAFRLASFFDAQTGELLARQPSENTESIYAPAVDATAVDSEGQAHSEPINEAMPWELPNLYDVSTLTSSSSSPSPAASANVSGTEDLSPEEPVPPADSHPPQQTKDGISDVRDKISEEICTPETATTSSESTIGDPFEQIASGGILSEAWQPDSVGEVSVTQGETSPIVPRGDAAATQDQECISGETRQEVRTDALCASEASVLTDLTKVLESPSDSAMRASDTAVIASSQMEEGSSSPLTLTEPVPTELTEAENTVTSFLQPVGQDSQELTVTQPSGSSDLSPEDPVLNETAEPRPQSESSWKSVFADPWKSEMHDLGNPAQPEEDSPCVEELIVEAPTVASQKSSENPFVDSRDGDQQPTHKDQSSPGHPIGPMPWDQVQESEISIHPAQLESPVEEPTDLIVDRSVDEARLGSTLRTDATDDQAPVLDTTSSEADSFSVVRDSEASQLPDSPILSEDDRTAGERGEIQISTPPQFTRDSQEPGSFTIVEDSEALQPPDASLSLETEHAADVSESRLSIPTQRNATSREADSFSIVQDSKVPHRQNTPISLEVQPTVAEVEQVFSSTQEESTFLKPGQQETLPTSSIMDETSTPDEQTTGVAASQPSEEPIADDQATVSEIHIKRIDSVLRLKDEPTPADLQLSAEKDSIDPPWNAALHTDELISETIGETSFLSHSFSSSPAMQTKQNIWETEPEIPVPPSVDTDVVETRLQRGELPKEAVVEARPQIPEPVPHQEKWQKAGESIRFVEEPQAAPMAKVVPPVSESQEMNRPLSAAASAVEVLFESTPDLKKTGIRERIVETPPSHRQHASILSSIRTAVAGFLYACFSTTRAIVATCVGLMVLSAMGVALCIGAIGLTWVIMEEPPSPAFQSLTTTPQRTLLDFKKNGYLLLLGIEATTGQDPVQAGYERNPDAVDAKAALTCFGGVGSGASERSNASADVMRGWFRGSKPVGQFKSRQSTIKEWVHEHQLTLNRYGQWQKLPFEDWGYGQPSSPPCVAMAFAHQLHVADGFVQSPDLGVDRLETDMEAWRIVLSQARTLPMKMLALQAINDDIAVASGLLVQSDFDGTHLGRVTKLLRPLDQGELSLRWPMQSELVAASKTYEDQLKTAQAEEQAVYTTIVSNLSLPKQRRLNEYAKYYDASYKAANEGQHTSLPKWKNYIHYPASTFMDYLTNPIENIVGLEPLPPWDLYNGLVVDTDAHLRLASLQAWLRRGPADGDLLTRIAKAGQSVYDPFTGLPMLVNMNKGVFYSVGHDGKDQDGDPELDVVAEIPIGHTTSASTKSATKASKAK
jgi:hypothetical protein